MISSLGSDSAVPFVIPSQLSGTSDMASSFLPLLPWPSTHLLSARNRIDSARSVQIIVLQLFILGYPEFGNRLIDALYDSNDSNDGDILLDHRSPTTEIKSLYAAWGATKIMPNYIRKKYNDRTSDNSIQQYFDLPADKWVNDLPECMRDRGREGKLQAKDLTFVGERMNVNPSTRISGESVGVGTVVQVATMLGEEKLARAIVIKEITSLYRYIQEKWDTPWRKEFSLQQCFGKNLGLDTVPRLWEILKDAQLGKHLGIDEQALEQYVEEGCSLIKQRFERGPIKPYVEKSISELLEILDEDLMAAQKLDLGGARMSSDEDESCPSTFLKPGVTEEQIAELETFLHENTPPDAEDGDEIMLPGNQTLPDDYKEFLRRSNGFYPSDNTYLGLLYPIEEVGLDDCAFLYQMEMPFSLLPYECLLDTKTSENEGMFFGHFACFHIGVGGDEGQVILIPPTSVRPIVERFEKVYQDASEKDKKTFEKAAIDYYGSLDKVWNLQWLCIPWYHWNPDSNPYGSFRDYLYSCIEDAQRKRGIAESRAEERAEKERDESGKNDCKQKASANERAKSKGPESERNGEENKKGESVEGVEEGGNTPKAEENNDSIATRVKRQRRE